MSLLTLILVCNVDIKRIWVILVGLCGLYIILFVPYSVTLETNEFDQLRIDKRLYFNGDYTTLSQGGYHSDWVGNNYYILVPIFTLTGLFLILIAGYLKLIDEISLSKFYSILIIIGGLLGFVGSILFIPFGLWVRNIGTINIYNDDISVIADLFNFYIGFYFSILLFPLITIYGITNVRNYLPKPEEKDETVLRLSQVAQARHSDES